MNTESLFKAVLALSVAGHTVVLSLEGEEDASADERIVKIPVVLEQDAPRAEAPPPPKEEPRPRPRAVPPESAQWR